MKTANFYRIGVLLAIALIFVGCSRSVAPDRKDATQLLQDVLNQTPRPDDEAELAALMYAQTLVAPEGLYQTFHSAFQSLRDTFGDSIPLVREMTFLHPWTSRSIITMVTDSVRTMFRSNSYHGFDSLNRIYRGNVVDIIGCLDDCDLEPYRDPLIVVIRFEGRLNLDTMVHVYEHCPGVTVCEPNYVWRGLVVDNLLPVLSDSGRVSFLLVDDKSYFSWPNDSGATGYFFHFFRVEGAQTTLVGDFELHLGAPLPDWWSDAANTFCQFHSQGFFDLCPGFDAKKQQ